MNPTLTLYLIATLTKLTAKHRLPPKTTLLLFKLYILK